MYFQRILLILVGIFILSQQSAFALDTVISAERLQQEISSESSLILLDVRSKKEFKRGHLQGAVHIPLKKLKKSLSQLPDKEQRVVVYCHSGPRAQKAISLLQKAGYQDVVELTGHYQAWKAAGRPLTQAP